MMIPIKIITAKSFSEQEIQDMINEFSTQPVRIMEPLEPAIIEIDKLKEELKAATTYIEENEVIHLKTKKNIPTVINYQGRRYVLDDRN